MNTITQEYSNKFIEIYDIELFNKVIKSFRIKANTIGLTSGEHILYNLVRNLPKKRGFTPIVNKVKIANGQNINAGYKLAKSNINHHLIHNFEILEKSFNLPRESQDYWLDLIRQN